MPLLNKSKQKNVMLPLYGTAVSCGFASQADDYVEKSLSLDDYLVDNPASTFFVRASGESMKNIGIMHGDLLIVDRAKEAKNGDIVLLSFVTLLN